MYRAGMPCVDSTRTAFLNQGLQLFVVIRVCGGGGDCRAYERMAGFQGSIKISRYYQLMPGRRGRDDLLQLVPRGAAQGSIGSCAEVRPPDMLIKSN